MRSSRDALLAAAGLIMGGTAPGFAESLTKEDADVRAAAIEARMTDEQRFQLLHGIMPISLPGVNIDPESFKGVPAIAGYVRGIPGLGVPDLLETDASLGVANPLQLRADRATALPSGLAIASTFDRQAAREGGAMIGAEARAFGYNVLLGGGVNLARDPRNGRNFEYLGEDPLLAGALAGEAIKGTQSQGVVSTVKHFSLNAQETLRNSLDARIDEAAHQESDLLAFRLAIEIGEPGAVMCAYNRVNGEYACGNDHLLNTVLKKEWRYKGWVMSDWGAVHDVSYFNAGLDQQSGAQLDKQVWFDAPLKAEVAAGRVSKARISDAVRRILRSIYAVGADRPAKKKPIDADYGASVARRVATQGIVLLKNDGVLPLASDAKSIIVVGGNADIGVMSGGGSSQVTPVGDPAAVIPVGGPGIMGIFGRKVLTPSSPVVALRAALPEGSSVTYDSGYSPKAAAARAASADIAVVVATQWQIEGFDAGMELPEGQNALIEAVSAANPNTIVVLQTGNPVEMPWMKDVKAILQAWYPGQKGGEAIADILTGKVNPSGRLPITWPHNETQNPRPDIPGLGRPEGSSINVEYSEGADVGYRWFAKHKQTPLFPFGYGLSYTSFEYAGLTVKDGERPTAAVSIRNIGEREGAEVAQLYLIDINGASALRLVGFDRVNLAPGEAKTVQFSIDPRLLGSYDLETRQWRVDGGRYTLAVGRSAANMREKRTLELKPKTFR